jgi:P pilus assembly chaperone PapD
VRRLLRATLLALSSVVPASLAAQGVLVAPPGIFIDHRVRSGSLELYNPGPDPAEISITLSFGFPVSDSLGTVSLLTLAEPDSSVPSAAKWIEAFPKRFTLRPQERQTVRLLGRPPASLGDGEYWARVIVEAKGGKLQLASPDSTAIQVGVALNVRTVVALLYRKGKVETGLAISKTRGQIVGDSLQDRSRFTRRGNAAFVGRSLITLSDSTGRERRATSGLLAVYYDLEPRYALGIDSLPPGRYTLRVTADTQREDVRREALLPIAHTQDTATVIIPARRP